MTFFFAIIDIDSLLGGERLSIQNNLSVYNQTHYPFRLLLFYSRVSNAATSEANKWDWRSMLHSACRTCILGPGGFEVICLSFHPEAMEYAESSTPIHDSVCVATICCVARFGCYEVE